VSTPCTAKTRLGACAVRIQGPLGTAIEPVMFTRLRLPRHFLRIGQSRGQLNIRAALVIGGAVGFSSAIALALAFPSAQSGRLSERSRSPLYSSVIKHNRGNELVMVVLGSAGCGVSQGSPVLRALRVLQDSLRIIATQRSAAFTSIGVALDADARSGIDWLRMVGRFDEVAAGGGWINTAAVEYVWRDTWTLAATPQVLVQLRTVRRDSHSRLVPPVTRVLIRMVGAPDIISMSGLRDVDSLLAARITNEFPEH
jgi:hypothetical protein